MAQVARTLFFYWLPVSVAALAFVATPLGPPEHATGQEVAENLVIESSRLQLVLREDLRGFAKLIDKRSGRDYCAGGNRSFGMYVLYFGKSFEKATRSMASNVVEKKLTRTEHGVHVRFEQKGPHPALVDCTISARHDRPEIRLAIDVTNRSSQPVVAVDFPLLTCCSQLGDNSTDDGLLYPQHEGVVLCDPAENLQQGASVAKPYPGSASTQFMYYFDPAGGLYCGAEDGAGHTKTLMVGRNRDGLTITWRHELPSVQLVRSKLPYDVVLSAGGATWQDGADIYRDWAEEHAPWCEKKIAASAAPDWLQQGNVFLNYTIDPDGDSFGPEQDDELFRRYRAFFGLPIVACAFGWEKHGSWIGPYYFPPRGGVDYYKKLAHRLAERGDHMHVFTSGFRWGVRKTMSPGQQTQPKKVASVPLGYQPAGNRRNRVAPTGDRQPRRYTDYYGRNDFYKHGGPRISVIDGRGSAVFKTPKWADNYLLCPGSVAVRELIGDSFEQIYDYGIAGVDLDQNLGAGIPHCYSQFHDHPAGAGVWQYRTVSTFLKDVRLRAREVNSDSFIGVEEPCEVFIPVVDIVHGRAFTDTVWPAAGPGSVSVPLYVYLYHPYQLNYAGWIDSGFSPLGDVRCGIARATIFGMQPGVRIGNGPFQLDEQQPSTELTMLRKAAQLTHRCRDYLLLGRMLHDPVVTGSPDLESVTGKRHPALPRAWPAVQATTWQSAAGNVCYAIANLSDAPHAIQLLVQRNGMSPQKVCLTRINGDGEQLVHAAIALPIRMSLKLTPWEICCVEQRLGEM